MVNVSSSNDKFRVSVSSKKEINSVDSSNSLARYFQELAKNWAIADDLVDNTDYSSKYYAEKSKDCADTSANLLEQTKEEAEIALNNIHDSKSAAIEEINTTEATAIENIETETTDSINSVIAEGTTQRNLLSADVSSAKKAAQEANASATSASASMKSASNYADQAKKAAQEAISGQLQADFSQTNTSAKDFIKNKPTKLTDFTDDLGSSPTHTHNQYLKQADTLKVQEITLEDYLKLKKKDTDTLYVVCTEFLVWGSASWGIGIWGLQDE